MKYTIATLGGHSALEILAGAKKRNFKTIVIVQKGREKTYTKYFRRLADSYIFLDKFKDLTLPKTADDLLEKNAIFIPHRYCQVYCDLEKLENDFPVKIFGNKKILKYEERTGRYNQYQIFKHAKIDFPIQFSSPEKIDRLSIVKVAEAERGYERAFFFASNKKEFIKKSGEMIKNGRIKKPDLDKAVIEEYIIGAQVNFNFFYSALDGSLELMGTDMRRQTNIDGYIRLPANIQNEINNYINPTYIETGHVAVTVKESLLESAFEIAEKIVDASKKISPPGIIGPFAIQCAVTSGPPREKIIVFDLSLRMPGSPGTVYTPYIKYLYGENISVGERIVMEIENAVKNKNINKILT